MPLLHVSLSAEAPERVAHFLAKVMGGRATPFPPFQDCWIAFASEDDGTAIEVYPNTHVLEAGPDQVLCATDSSNAFPSFVHVALATYLATDEIIEMATAEGWTARLCDRGPFQCVEVWLENRLLVELLDERMQDDYRRGMTIDHWTAMFGLE
jgi:hypothetical protein